MAISITIAPYITDTTVSTEVTTITANLAIASAAGLQIDADNVVVDPYGTISSTNLQTALEQLADQNFRGTTEPTGSTLQIGDTWYDTTNNIFYVYRTVSGVTDWYPILNTDADKPDRLDGGAF
jgi:hypothetical protein